jgi:methylenetetrahydrofolate reductase (NADPH)
MGTNRSDIGFTTTGRRGFEPPRRPHLSYEFYPPKTPKGWLWLKETAAILTRFEPDFVSVSFGAGGSARERTYETAVSLHRDLDLDVAPHLSCLRLSRERLEEFLTLYSDAGFDRLLALRGDVPVGPEPIREAASSAKGFRYANELVSFINERGGFSVIVACYPEGHPEASDIGTDIDNFARKVEAGAELAITQYFFNNAGYFRFVEEVRRRGVDIPIVVGLMPLVPYEQVVRFSEKCGADIPRWIGKRMEAYQDDPRSQQRFATEVAVQQADELLSGGAPGVHFFTMNRADVTLAVCDHLFDQEAAFGISWSEAACVRV